MKTLYFGAKHLLRESTLELFTRVRQPVLYSNTAQPVLYSNTAEQTGINSLRTVVNAMYSAAAVEEGAMLVWSLLDLSLVWDDMRNSVPMADV